MLAPGGTTDFHPKHSAFSILYPSEAADEAILQQLGTQGPGGLIVTVRV